MARLKLTGVDEGLSTMISTKITGADHPEIILEAIQTLFPEFNCGLPKEPRFPTDSNDMIAAENVPLDGFLDALHSQRILDTALDAMSRNLDPSGTMFEISRQALMAGKVAFPLPGETPLGGVVVIEIGGQNLGDWLEAATWHAGRETIPRHIGDELQMEEDGESSTWH